MVLTVIHLQMDLSGTKALLDAVQSRVHVARFLRNRIFPRIRSFVSTNMPRLTSLHRERLQNLQVYDLVPQDFRISSDDKQWRQSAHIRHHGAD